MILGCGGSAAIRVNRCTSATALAAPLAALGVGAGCPCDGASDGVSVLGAESDDVSEGFSVGVSAGASTGISVIIGAGVGAITGALWMPGALMGLIGLSGLVGLVTDLVHESLTKFHCGQIGWPYGSGQRLWRV